MEKSIDYREYIELVCFLGVEAAFNNVKTEAICRALKRQNSLPFISMKFSHTKYTFLFYFKESKN